MRPSQNPSQTPDKSNSDSPFTFLISHKNPYDHPGHASPPSSRYASAYQPSTGVSERSSSLFSHAEPALNVDHQLSSGWYVLYKNWLHCIIILQGFAFLFGMIGLLGIHIYFFSYRDFSSYTFADIIQSTIEVFYAITTIQVLRDKKFEKTMFGFKLAIVDCIALGVEIGIGAFRMISSLKTEGDNKEDSRTLYFLIMDILLLLHCCFVIVMPAWKIKSLVEKREAALRRNSDLYNLLPS